MTTASASSYGGSSKRGPHRLASTACERLWALRSVHGVVAKYDPPTRLQGTLIHTCLAYHNAALMPVPPVWLGERTLGEALEIDGAGNPALIRVALDVYAAYRHQFSADTWLPLSVEEEYEATIGELDPGGPDPSLDAEIITCRTDLVMKTNGMPWIVDHKATGGGWNGKERLETWKDDGEYKLSWQVMTNLHILRTAKNQAKIGGLVRGFIIQRLKHRTPYDFDRHTLTVPALAYADAPRAMRSYVAKERAIFAKLARGERPDPNFSMCVGRYGNCDYHALCSSSSKEEQASVLATAFRTTK